MDRALAFAHRHRKVLSAVVLTVAIVWPLSSMFRFGGTAMEEGLILIGGELVLEGKTPNGDFEHLYGPGGLWFVATAFAIFGVSITVERIVGLAYRVLLIWAIHRIARAWGWGVATGAALLAWAIIAPFGLIAYSWIGAIAFATASLALALDAEDRSRRWVVAGVLAGVSLLFRADVILALTLGLAPVISRQRRPAQRQFLAGLGVGVIGYTIHFATAGPLDVVRGMFIDPIIRLRPGRRLPVPPSWTDSGDFFARLDDFSRGSETLPGLDRPAQIAALFWVTIVVAAATIWWARRASNNRLLAFALFSAGTLPQLIQRPSPNHVKFVGVLVFSAAVVAVATRLARRGVSGIAAPAVLIALVVIAPHHIGRFTKQVFFESAPDISITHQNRTIPLGDPVVLVELEELLTALDDVAQRGDRVFVGPVALARTNYSDTFLYHLLPDYEPASYHLEMNPGLANRTDGKLARDVASADWLILNSLFDGWSEPNTSVEDGDGAAQTVVDESFCAIKTVGTRTLYRRC